MRQQNAVAADFLPSAEEASQSHAAADQISLLRFWNWLVNCLTNQLRIVASARHCYLALKDHSFCMSFALQPWRRAMSISIKA